MWAVVVEVDAPCRRQIAGMAQSVEEVLVQAFVPHPAIEGLHKAILHWFARRDVMPVNLPVLLPLQDRIRSQFGSVVADHHAGIASHLGDPIQLTGYADAGQGRINDRRTGCRTQSRATTFGSVLAGSPSVLWGPVHACVRPVYERLTLLHGRSDTASFNSRASLRASAGYAAVDIQSAAVRMTAP